MEITVTTPAGNTCRLWQFISRDTTRDHVLNYQICIGFPNRYYNMLTDTYDCWATQCWVDPILLSELLSEYDKFLERENVTPPTTLIQGL